MRVINRCRRLIVEFMHYVISTRSLRKSFISIKGIYYQAEIVGETVTWIVPHNLPYKEPSTVDFRVLETFTEFYVEMLGFVNCKLYSNANLFYPPKLNSDSELDKIAHKSYVTPEEDFGEHISALSLALLSTNTQTGDDIEQIDEFPDMETTLPAAYEQARQKQEKLKRLRFLFEGKKFFLNREVNREALTFIIR